MERSNFDYGVNCILVEAKWRRRNDHGAKWPDTIIKLNILLAAPLGKKKQCIYVLIGYLSEQDQGPSYPLGIARLDPVQEKIYMEWT